MLFNQYGVRVYTIAELGKVVSSEINKTKKEIRDWERKATSRDVFARSQLDQHKGYLSALVWMQQELNREHWRPGREIKDVDTPKGKIFQYIDENIIPEQAEEDLDTFAIFKEFINGILPQQE